MRSMEFAGEVEALASVIMEAMEKHFTAKGVVFSREAFLQQSSVDLEQLALDAHMFGAEIFPNDAHAIAAA